MACNLLIIVTMLTTCVGIYSLDITDGGGCEPYDVIQCGDRWSRYRLRYCSTNRADVKKIISVHLDLRFNNRFCTRGATELFGISADDEPKIWVSNFCYGTFFVCVELETESSYEETTVALEITTSTMNESTTTTSVNSDGDGETISNASESSGSRNNTEVRETGNDVVTELNKDTSGRKGETNKPSLPFIESIPKSKSSNDSRTTPSMTQNPRHLVAEPGSKMDSTMKVIIMAAIGAGGLVLILLICVTAYLLHTCNNKPKGHSVRVSAFKNPSLSTSELLPAEHINDKSVYDQIPADRTNSNTIGAPVYRQYNHPPVKPKPEGQNIANIQATHEYFTLVPEVCRHCAPKICTTNSGVYSHTQEEGVYDRLIAVPRTSVSDSSTYNHLWQFSRERKLTEDMCTQTDLTELD